MPRLINRSGERFGKLLVLSRAGTNSLKKVLWRCLCDCGNECTVVSGDLVTGNTQSCGCIVPNLKHGGSRKSSYHTWRAMMRRCNNPKDKDYYRYGAQGITVCDAWHDYRKFAEDMGEPSGTETLDRINPYGSYSPENCRWAPLPVQARNLRVRASSKTGITGVSSVGNGKWMAKITAGKKSFYSKCFSTIEEAAAARKELELKHWSAA